MKINTKNIFVAGDIHGYPRPLCSQIEEYGLRDSVFFLLGDIGLGFYGDHIGSIEFLNEEGLKYNNIFYLIRGNHDNPRSFTRKNKQKIEEQFSNVRLIGNFEDIELEFNGKKGLVVPGAISIDRARRVKNKSWWAKETINYKRIPKLKGKHYDFILAHSGPEPLYIRVDNAVEEIAERQDPALLIDLKEERTAIDSIIDLVKPLYWINGHYHKFASFQHKGINVYTIAECSGDEEGCLFELPKALIE